MDYFSRFVPDIVSTGTRSFDGFIFAVASLTALTYLILMIAGRRSG